MCTLVELAASKKNKVGPTYWVWTESMEEGRLCPIHNSIGYRHKYLNRARLVDVGKLHIRPRALKARQCHTCYNIRKAWKKRYRPSIVCLYYSSGKTPGGTQNSDITVLKQFHTGPTTYIKDHLYPLGNKLESRGFIFKQERFTHKPL